VAAHADGGVSMTEARTRLQHVKQFLEALDRRFPEGISLDISAAIREELDPLERAASSSMTLEEYFTSEFVDGKIDHWARAHVHEGVVEIYIHPHGRDGQTTPLLIVTGNSVKPKFPPSQL
jgi:hypothetical protein